MHNFVLSGIDVLTKYFFAVPVTNGSADTVGSADTENYFITLIVPIRFVSRLQDAMLQKFDDINIKV